MDKKITLIILSIIIFAVITTYFIIDFLVNDQQNKNSHNNRFVQNCIPAGPDKAVKLILIENRTHHFDLGTCIWIQK